MKSSSERASTRQAWNRFQWRVTGRRTGRSRNLVLHVEQLESRSLLAGDLVALDPSCDQPQGPLDTVAEMHTWAAPDDGVIGTAPVVGLSLQLTNSDGTPLKSLQTGQDFTLHVFAEDLRESPQGIFSAYFDLSWDSALAAVTGPLQFSANYPNLHLGDTSIPGTVDEAGAFASFEELGAGPHEILSVPLRATAAGNLVITSDAAETPINQVLAYGLNQVLPAENVQFGKNSMAIDPAPMSSSNAQLSTASLTTGASDGHTTSLEESPKVAGASDELLKQLILNTLTPPAQAVSPSAPAADATPGNAPAKAPSIETPLATAKLSLTGSNDAQKGDSQADEGDAIEEALSIEPQNLSVL